MRAGLKLRVVVAVFSTSSPGAYTKTASWPAGNNIVTPANGGKTRGDVIIYCFAPGWGWGCQRTSLGISLNISRTRGAPWKMSANLAFLTAAGTIQAPTGHGLAARCSISNDSVYIGAKLYAASDGSQKQLSTAAGQEATMHWQKIQ